MVFKINQTIFATIKHTLFHIQYTPTVLKS